MWVTEIKVNISSLRFRTDCVPTTVIDVGTRFIKDWSCRNSISHTGEGNLLTSRFMFEGSPESLIFAFAVMTTEGVGLLMWAKHVEVAKRQEGIPNDTFCPRRKRRMNNLLKLGTGCGRLCTVMRVSVVVISFEVSGHVEGT
jgi:hypothetical protein